MKQGVIGVYCLHLKIPVSRCSTQWRLMLKDGIENFHHASHPVKFSPTFKIWLFLVRNSLAASTYSSAKELLIFLCRKYRKKDIKAYYCPETNLGGYKKKSFIQFGSMYIYYIFSYNNDLLNKQN